MNRSGWGSAYDFVNFEPKLHHGEQQLHDGSFWARIEGCCQGTGNTREEARRIAVVHYCTAKNTPLPWAPDKPSFHAWSKKDCKEYISGIEGGAHISTYTDSIESALEGYALIIKMPHDIYKKIGSDKIGPTLKDWQDAAEWVWTQVNK